MATDFRSLFEPRTIAVVGASSTGTGPANNFIRYLRAFGYAGRVYPIHPTAEAVEDVRTWGSLRSVPEAIDYAYVAVASEHVEGVLEAGRGRVRFAQVISSGFGEAPEGRAREARVVATARACGIRLLGPNCLGTHSPRGRVTFIEHALPESGTVGVISQSGGLSADILQRGQVRGVRFSGLVSVGNCADVTVSEVLDYMLADPVTQVIGLYVENASEGRALFEVLRRARSAKPVVLLKGGRTPQGQKVAASHTGALASDYRIWVALARQTGCALVDTVDELVDGLLAFQLVRLNPVEETRRVVLFGNGGGTSVLATDQFVERGFDVPGLGHEGVAAMNALKLPPGSIVANPIDVPASAMRHGEGRVAGDILEISYSHGAPHAVIMHVNMTVILGYRGVDILGNLLLAAASTPVRANRRVHFMLVLRSDGRPDVENVKREARSRALAAGIPVFDELRDAATALGAIRTVERFRMRDAR